MEGEKRLRQRSGERQIVLRDDGTNRAILNHVDFFQTKETRERLAQVNAEGRSTFARLRLSTPFHRSNLQQDLLETVNATLDVPILPDMNDASLTHLPCQQRIL